MRLILEKLKRAKYRNSTANNYLAVWRKFNDFVQRLDIRPKSWEDRACLYGAFLIDKGIQSSTLKSYMSAIKHTLLDNGYKWNDDLVLLNTMTKACKVMNNRITTRFPIHKNLLETIVFELHRLLRQQPFLLCMYKAWFLIAYYGLFRVGELAFGTHYVRACDVHIAKNKNKLLFILYSSKTHDQGSQPQTIKVTADMSSSFMHGRLSHLPPVNQNRFFCPFSAS